MRQLAEALVGMVPDLRGEVSAKRNKENLKKGGKPMAMPEEMDKAAAEAENDLSNLIGDGRIGCECADAFVDWWGRWFMKAGHKRLGRILVAIHKENLKKGGKTE